MILLSGMHLTIDTHICGDEVAQVKWSFSQEKGTCGMEMIGITTPIQNGISSKCCEDQTVAYTVDNNYQTSTLEISKPDLQLLQVFLIPQIIGSLAISTSFYHNSNVQPPGKFLACAVSLPDICVFRI